MAGGRVSGQPVDSGHLDVRRVCTACGQPLGNSPTHARDLLQLDPHPVDEDFPLRSGAGSSRTIPATATPGQRVALSVEKGHAPAVSYRDWGRGEGSPREPIAGWA